MKNSSRFVVPFAFAGLLIFLSAPDVFARGGFRGGGGGSRGGGDRSFSGSGSFGSVRQSNFHSSGNLDNGQANFNRELSGSGGHSLEASGNAEFGDGQANVSRQVSGPEGRSASSAAGARVDDGQLNTFRGAAVSGDRGSYGAVRVGSSVGTLPAGCHRSYWRGSAYYYRNGYCYRPVYVDGGCTYTVIEPPDGFVIYSLPDGAVTEVVGGVTYFVYNGVYYKQTFSNGQVGYMVVPNPQ